MGRAAKGREAAIRYIITEEFTERIDAAFATHSTIHNRSQLAAAIGVSRGALHNALAGRAASTLAQPIATAMGISLPIYQNDKAAEAARLIDEIPEEHQDGALEALRAYHRLASSRSEPKK